MFLDLTPIRQPETPVCRTLAPEAFEPSDDFRILDPVRLELTLHKHDDQYRLAGRVTSRLEVACSRCLEPFQVPVDATIDLRYLPQALAGDRDQDPNDDPSTAFYADDRIDLGQLVREQCYLTLPMKPLCRVDCRGLCAVCGTNLNVERCSCAPQWVDPRLAGLQALVSSRTNDDA